MANTHMRPSNGETINVGDDADTPHGGGLGQGDMTTPGALSRGFRPGPSVTAGGPAAATLVSTYMLNSGAATDSTGTINGTVVGTWAATDTASVVNGVAGNSMFKENTAHITLPADQAAHALSALSVGFYYQPTLGANKHVLFACAAAGATAAGDFSIERLTNGRLRGWHVGQDGELRFFESTDGIAAINLQIGTAYRITLTLGPSGARLYLGNTEVASISENKNGWNNARVKYLGVWADGTTDPAQGLFGHLRIWSGELTASDVAALAAAQTATSPATGEHITTPENHGWSDGNTVAQNTAAFNAAIEEANANAGTSSTGRGVVELRRGKTYTVRTTSGSDATPGACLTALSNVEIRTTGKPTRSSGNQATIQFESWSGKIGVKMQVLLLIGNSINNFKLGWLRLHGNKNTLNSPTDVDYTSGQDGGIHLTTIRDATNITFKEVLGQHALNDALYLRTNSALNPSLLIEDCTFQRCRRQGISIIRVGTSGGGTGQVTCRRLRVADIGDFPGDIAGQRPGAGIDIEPNRDSQQIHGITCEDCEFGGVLGSTWHHGINDGGQSDGAGFLGQARSTMTKLRIRNCTFTGNRRGIVLKASGNPTHTDVEVKNCVITGSTNDNRIRLESAGADGGTLVDCNMINNNTTGYFIEPSLNRTGHRITIWRGNFSPTLTNTGDRQSITLNDGLPG